MDTEGAALTRDVVEQFGVLRVVLEHQGEFVGHHEERGNRWQVVSCGDGLLVLTDRVEGTALHIATGLLEQVLATRHLPPQRVGETICQRTLLCHVGDHGDNLREVAEDVGARLTLEIGVDDDQAIRRVGRQERQQNRHEGLGLTGACHTDHQTVRPHAAFGLILQVEHERLARGCHSNRHA
ncbi:Uncharacterised protein [Mycobacteroides abscessus subsp. massiliense]|nr:Uncharacterised protein [Mycobacteroides abscessus subsp. massiliense]